MYNDLQESKKYEHPVQVLQDFTNRLMKKSIETYSKKPDKIANITVEFLETLLKENSDETITKSKRSS